MKKYFRIGLAAVVSMGMLAACEQRPMEIEPVMDPATKPVITITRIDDAGTIEEGDTLVYEITTDKMLSQSAIDFAPVFSENSGVDDLDYIVSGGTLSTFSNSTILEIIIVEDNYPENEETLEFDIVASEVAQNWQLNPSTDVEELSSPVTNVNDPDALTVAFAWDDPEHHSDFDLLVNYGATSWSAAATSDNPEITTDISHAYTQPYDGTYYVGVDPYDVPDDVTSYTISVGYPDGTVEMFTGNFDMSMLDTYPTDYFAAYDLDMYRMLVIEKTGDQYTVDFVHD